MKDIILIDAGTGNLRSVQKALEKVGARVERTEDPKIVLSAGCVILPGVGAFGDFMAGLRVKGLDDAVKVIARRGVPLLGICVGMQALFEVGKEMGEHRGLGLLPGRVVRFAESLSVKVPHTVWIQVEARRDDPLFRQIPKSAYAYFNHSYYCQADDHDAVGCGPIKLGHLIQRVAREERLGLPLSGRSGSQTRSDDRLVRKTAFSTRASQ